MHTHLPLGQADELLGGWSQKLEGVLLDPVTYAVFPWGRQLANNSASFPGPPSGPWGERVDKTQFLPWGCFQDSGHSWDPCSLCPVREGVVFCGRRRGAPPTGISTKLGGGSPLEALSAHQPSPLQSLHSSLPCGPGKSFPHLSLIFLIYK